LPAINSYKSKDYLSPTHSSIYKKYAAADVFERLSKDYTTQSTNRTNRRYNIGNHQYKKDKKNQIKYCYEIPDQDPDVFGPKYGRWYKVPVKTSLRPAN
jgi:hypothetical protein